MSTVVRSFDYVNHPYDAVRDALVANAVGVFSSATNAASSRAAAVAAALRMPLGGLEVAAPIVISPGNTTELPPGTGHTAKLVISFTWKAADRPELFPTMNADLSVYALTSTETQLDFSGHYDPPLGPFGSAIDAAVGYRIAQASVHRFVTDVAQYLRDTLH